MTKLHFFQCYFTGPPPEPFIDWPEYIKNCCSGDIPCLHGIEIKARKWKVEAMRPQEEEEGL